MLIVLLVVGVVLASIWASAIGIIFLPSWSFVSLLWFGIPISIASLRLLFINKKRGLNLDWLMNLVIVMILAAIMLPVLDRAMHHPKGHSLRNATSPIQ
jgi:hypothetical protein